MKPSGIQGGLIFLVALGVDIFLIWAAKTKVAKLMWASFGAFLVLLLVLMVVWDALYRNPSLHPVLWVLLGITAAPFLVGVFFAYIVAMTGDE